MKKNVLPFFSFFKKKKLPSKEPSSSKKDKKCIVIIFIYNEENKGMFACSEPENGKIRIELMHSTFSSKKIWKQKEINNAALKTFNDYLNPLSELNIQELDFEEIEVWSILCHIIYIPNSKVRIMAYNKPHCLLDINEFKTSKIESKSDLEVSTIRTITELAFNNSPIVKVKGDKLKSA